MEWMYPLLHGHYRKNPLFSRVSNHGCWCAFDTYLPFNVLFSGIFAVGMKQCGRPMKRALASLQVGWSMARLNGHSLAAVTELCDVTAYRFIKFHKFIYFIFNFCFLCMQAVHFPIPLRHFRGIAICKASGPRSISRRIVVWAVDVDVLNLLYDTLGEYYIAT